MKNFESLVVFKSNNRVTHINLEDINHEDSLISPQSGGNCINWILGHIIASRYDVYDLLGIDKSDGSDLIRLYDRGTKNVDGKSAIRLEKLIEYLDSSLTKLEEHIPEVDFKDREDDLKMLAFLSFHEAYHCGQIGLLRRIVGREGAIK